MSLLTDTGAAVREKQSDTAATAPLWPGVGAIVLSQLAIIAGVSGYFAATGGADEPPAGVLYAISGAGLLFSFGVLWWYLSPAQRHAAFPLRWLSRSELGWTLLFVPAGLVAFLAGEQLGVFLGGEPIAFAYDVTEPTVLIGVLFGPIFMAPLIEELLYRGILISALEDRGWSVVAVGAASVTVFAVTHLPVLGIPGVFAIAGMAVFPTVLRLQFDNLAGAWLHHLLNNIVAYLLYPLLFV